MSGRRITILVGTDHHGFERLVRWADSHQTAHPADTVVIQHGHTAGPGIAQGVAFFSPEELGRLAAESDVVITHGGPGTIMDVRKQGHRPITLARNPEHGEHVDDHQMRFAAWAADKGLVHLVTEVEEITALVADLASTREDTTSAHSTDATALRLSQLLDSFDGRRLSAVPGSTTVLYLAADEHSGTDVVERLLGSIDGVVVLGEVAHLWHRALASNEACGCGRPFQECEFWRAIGERAFGGWNQLDLRHVLRLKAEVDRQRRLTRTVRRWPAAEQRRRIVEYSEYYRRIYDAAAELTGADLVVDSSRLAPTAAALSHNRHIDLRLLHLVRDSRAVVHSRASSEAAAHEPSRTTSQTARQWVRHDLTMRGLAYRGVQAVPARFEDVLTQPAAALARVWRELGLPGEPRVPVSDGKLELRPVHAVAGYPLRFESGHLHLESYDMWRAQLPAGQRRLSTALTYPVLRRHGYLRSGS
ncbi:MAG TPA: glycosyltransferase [Nocardioidaceae bacterium]|nr:glycosyltransferase [Nocardioidaceae bacterium]